MSLPIIELDAPAAGVASQMRAACTEHGFFYVANHGVDLSLVARLSSLAHGFFALPLEQKMTIAMEKGGIAWRGYFPVGNELTSGAPDRKEGLYFGEELDDADPRVARRTPLHGKNLFPASPGAPLLRDAVLDTRSALTALGHRVCRGLAESLGLPADYLEQRYTKSPTILFRIFHYPPSMASASTTSPRETWGVGEHTDYGLLTLLAQDDVGGLEVRTARGWLDAPPREGTFVCNIGDMLERMTGGLYRSTPHRVRSHATKSRISLPFFFDPGWDAKVLPIESPRSEEEERSRQERWDGASVFDFGGTYGEYLLGKVQKVFPELARQAL
jgi:isopenicillin N synthase-like dioxygenase